MKAWHFTAPNQPLALVEIPEPVPAAGEVVIDVKGVGICHSDVGFMDGSLISVMGPTPVVLGHEISGVVSAIGQAVTGVEMGQRVAVYSARPGDHPGVTRDGGYADKVAIPAFDAIALADNVDWTQAAAATDAGMTSYHATVTVGGVTAGTRVGIIGLGGLGLTGARICVLRGAEVYAAEIDEAIHPVGRERGVREVVSDAADLAEFGLDVIVDFAGFGTTTAGAITAVNRSGRVVQVGVGRTESTIDTMAMVNKEVTLVGCYGGLPADLEAVLKFIAEGRLRINTERITFDQIPDGLARLARGQVSGVRLVAEL
jgi:D-arabinose 1-dehydrogenase-like Zn-dependent alcohol dehydrogenase